MARSRTKLLLVDDSELALQVTAAALTDAGYDVRTSTQVKNLRTTFGDWLPDVILTDVNMPGISGVELCRMLKSSYDTAHVPVVLFSALPEHELEALASECEADGFLTKADLAQLPGAIAKLVETELF